MTLRSLLLSDLCEGFENAETTTSLPVEVFIYSINPSNPSNPI